MPTMPPAAMLEVMRGKHVQFWGDSTSAQMECDLRGALDRVAAPPPLNNASRYWRSLGSSYARGAFSSSYHRVGCPWHCARDGSEEQRQAALVARGRRATHVVFNLGEHYRKNHTERMPSAIRHFAAALAQLDATIVIRSSSVTHFPTATGEFSDRSGAIGQCAPRAVGTAPRPWADVYLRQMQALLANHSRPVLYLDVRQASDDYTQHPKYKDGQPFSGDCLHFCQDCVSGVLRAWNSALLGRLRDLGRR